MAQAKKLSLKKTSRKPVTPSSDAVAGASGKPENGVDDPVDGGLLTEAPPEIGRGVERGTEALSTGEATGSTLPATSKNTSRLNFVNFTIRIRDYHEGTFMVEVVNSPVGRMRTPDVIEFNRDVVPYIKKLANPHVHGEMKDAELIEMGQMLGDMLFPITVRRMFFQSWSKYYSGHPTSAGMPENNGRDPSRTGIRILLELDDDNLAIVP